MITIPISVDIADGTAPYTFTYSSNNTNVTFSNVTGTASYSAGIYSASTNVQYATQGDINTTIISVTFVDANGCSTTLSPVVVDNPCTLQSSISNNGEFVFVANTTGGSGSYTYTWVYDTDIWSLQTNDTSPTDNFLSLKLKDYPVPPTSTLIGVTIMDSNGCSLYKTYTYTFCKPTFSNKSVSLVCDSTPSNGCTGTYSQIKGVDLKPLLTLCSNQTIAWPTLEFTIPYGICLKHVGNGVVYISSFIPTAQTVSITYTARTVSGIKSEVGTIVVTIPNCSVQKPSLYGIPQTIQLTIDDVVSDTKLLNVESRVAGTPDWSTFAFVGSPTWGTVTFNGNRDIVYTITDVTTTPTVPDTISWSLNDYAGGQINIVDTVLRNRIALPSLVTEVVCNSCGETSGPIDLLANDTGSIDRSTVQIVLNDPDIVITKDTDNNFTFTSLPGASFNNLNSYKVANIQGAYSTNQNFFVRTACVGPERTPTVDLTCQVAKTTNIVDAFGGSNCFGYSFTETSTTTPTYTTQGGTIGGTGDLDFTGINVGTYTFEFTCENQSPCNGGAFDDIGNFTVIHGATPRITNLTGSDNGNGTISFTFDYVSVNSSFTVTNNSNPASFQLGVIANAGSGIFTIYGVSGNNEVVVSSTTICGTYTSDTDTVTI